jgi:hypothetical protein
MKIKLTLGELVALFNELNGQVIDQKTGERSKGVLSYKLSIRAKHILNNDLNKKIAEDVKAFEESRLELFKELGEQEGDMWIVKPENQEELFKKIQELESIEKNVEVPKINAGELYNIETEDYWPILLDKLLAKPEAKVVEAEEIAAATVQSEAPIVPL